MTRLALAPATIHRRAHLAHRGGEAVEDRLADQEMADIELAISGSVAIAPQ
jgi:hypothetical protein